MCLSGKSDILPVEGDYLMCPICRQSGVRRKLLRIGPDTEAKNIHLFCRFCKTELNVNIERGQCSRSPSP